MNQDLENIISEYELSTVTKPVETQTEKKTKLSKKDKDSNLESLLAEKRKLEEQQKEKENEITMTEQKLENEDKGERDIFTNIFNQNKTATESIMINKALKELTSKSATSTERNKPLSKGEKYKRAKVKETKEITMPGGSKETTKNFDASKAFAIAWNEKKITSLKGPQVIMMATHNLVEKRIKLQEGVGLSQSPTIIFERETFVTSLKAAGKLSVKGIATDITRSSVSWPTEPATEELVGLRGLVRTANGWGLTIVKVGDTVLKGTQNLQVKKRGDTKFALKDYTEDDLNARKVDLAMFGAESIDPSSLLKLAVLASKGKLNPFTFNEFAKRFNPNWF